ncbi:MAG: filamentation induced by cAMP protein fic [Chloroflexi bacterium OLB14]|nr:MAG: filamentation induced by cAMP protein fic [Chloroflexi bacterium OLB14]
MSFNPTYPHKLSPLPPSKEIANIDFDDLLIKARVQLAELKGMCGQIPNPLLLMSPAIIRESVASSNIENINTTLADVLQWQLFPEAEQRQPDKEVLRYREAMNWGFDNLGKYALSTRLINGIQSRLMPNGNGQYRREQNQIANLASGESLYTPPIASDIPTLISNWENYTNYLDESIDPLIRAIISHYQFEAIHPFRDGNGRTGRILMVLQLIKYDLLQFPVLYISGYINQYRSEYYHHLLNVTRKQDWHGFIEYMLQGFYIKAVETRHDLQSITVLFEKIKEQIRSQNKKIYGLDLVEALFTYPVITPTKLASQLNMHYTTTSRYLSQLAEMGILKEAFVGKHHLFLNHKLLKILGKSS